MLTHTGAIDQLRLYTLPNFSIQYRYFFLHTQYYVYLKIQIEKWGIPCGTTFLPCLKQWQS